MHDVRSVTRANRFTVRYADLLCAGLQERLPQRRLRFTTLLRTSKRPYAIQALHRKDRKLTAKCKVCDVHFESDDIVKHYRRVVAGQEVLIPRGKWELAPGAVPRLFPALPPHISKPKCSGFRRKSPPKRTASRESPVPSLEEPPEIEQQNERQAITYIRYRD